jgi:hypothetical protein
MLHTLYWSASEHAALGANVLMSVQVPAVAVSLGVLHPTFPAQKGPFAKSQDAPGATRNEAHAVHTPGAWVPWQNDVLPHSLLSLHAAESATRS